MTHYGGDIKTVEVRNDDGLLLGWVVEHVGPDLHEQVPPGEQCRCGWMNLGVVE